MSESVPPIDYYELLQLSPNADQDTINRVYRLLAQRLHPDNQDTGNEALFRAVTDAHKVLSDPERRAKYDVAYHAQKHDRWKLSSPETRAETNFEAEQVMRLTVLEVLYARRRIEPKEPGPNYGARRALGQPLELSLRSAFLQRRLIIRTDNSKLAISTTASTTWNSSRRNLQRRRLSAERCRFEHGALSGRPNVSGR